MDASSAGAGARGPRLLRGACLPRAPSTRSPLWGRGLPGAVPRPAPCPTRAALRTGVAVVPAAAGPDSGGRSSASLAARSRGGLALLARAELRGQSGARRGPAGGQPGAGCWGQGLCGEGGRGRAGLRGRATEERRDQRSRGPRPPGRRPRNSPASTVLRATASPPFHGVFLGEELPFHEARSRFPSGASRALGGWARLSETLGQPWKSRARTVGDRTRSAAARQVAEGTLSQEHRQVLGNKTASSYRRHLRDFTLDFPPLCFTCVPPTAGGGRLVTGARFRGLGASPSLGR